MTAPDETALERLAEEIGERAAGAVVFGDAVTAEGVTVIPVAEVGCGFGLGPTPVSSDGADASGGLQVGGAGGLRARPRGFIEIKDGAATYRPLPNPWLTAALPLAAFLAGTAVPRLVRLIAQRRASPQRRPK
ncbi:GerW family sporulation protein [Streptomyces anatolicus]|uniref:GerW family sporulation protein n=1 Tax=Streptomyces anatolicus TaxID=2675858 RepID=UPI001CA58ACC|nr:spore germination protein GerW family protein [Streptomyces anatolicus]